MIESLRPLMKRGRFWGLLVKGSIISMTQSPLIEILQPISAAGVSGEIGFQMREIPFKTHLNLRGDANDSKFLICASALLGIDLPLVPNAVVESSGWQVCWLGPDEWLLIGSADQDVLMEFQNQFSQSHCAVVDLSGGQTIIRAGGHAWRDVLASACPLDLHSRVFKPRQCAQTVFAHTNVLLSSVSNDDGREVRAVDIVVRRSFADHVGRWLIDAAAECGVEFELPIE